MLVDSDEFVAMVLDIGLPVMNGMDVLREVRGPATTCRS